MPEIIFCCLCVSSHNRCDEIVDVWQLRVGDNSSVSLSSRIFIRQENIVAILGRVSAACLGEQRPPRLTHPHTTFLTTSWVSMGILSDGSYGIPKDIVFSFPVTIKNGEY